MDLPLEKLWRALPLLALAHAPWAALPARADGWLVSPTVQLTPESITQRLGKSGMLESIDEVLVGLHASDALKQDYRLIDLETGEVRVVAPGELANITWVDGGQIVTASLAASRTDQIVLVLSDYQGMGAAIVVMQDARVTSATVLTADQRLLLGEPPCDIGFAPESDMSGTQCVDIDECAAMLDDCAENASCENSEGSFECECDADFEGDGKICMAPGTMDPDGGMMAMDGGDAGRMDMDMDEMEEAMAKAKDGGCSCAVVGAQPDTESTGAGWLAAAFALGAALTRLGRRQGRRQGR